MESKALSIFFYENDVIQTTFFLKFNINSDANFIFQYFDITAKSLFSSATKYKWNLYQSKSLLIQLINPEKAQNT